MRQESLALVRQLERAGIKCFVHGSVARGDVCPSSDIDVVILEPIPSYRIELAVGNWVRREIVQATPSSVIKGHIHVDQNKVVSFPLVRAMTRETEFYRWGGLVNIEQLQRNERAPGVDKRLLFIEPTESGHIESGVIGYEHIVARKLGVSIGIANERVRVLLRRDQIGRTGVYLNHVLAEDENFEAAIRYLVDRDPAIRRTVERRSRRS
ncbi:MAG: nucleotidyltransferase domain-containing protein [Candidatus Thorarchaeota archaeon]